VAARRGCALPAQTSFSSSCSWLFSSPFALPLGVLLHARAEPRTDAERHLLANLMILCFAHDVLVLASKPHPLLSPICGRLRTCFPSSDTLGPWRLVSKPDVPTDASCRAEYLVRTVGLWT